MGVYAASGSLGTLPLVVWMASSRRQRPHYQDGEALFAVRSGRVAVISLLTPLTQATGVALATRGCRRDPTR